MASASPIPMQQPHANLRPKRGQIKAQIFEGLVKTAVSAVLKAAEALGLYKQGGEGAAAAAAAGRARGSDGPSYATPPDSDNLL